MKSALLATGGFGRRELFPCSDVDVLFLCANEKVEPAFGDSIRACIQAMWDIGLRASPATRTLKECERVHPDNLEFTVSLLDRRFLAGSRALYTKFENELLPFVILREWDTIVQNLAEMARARHAKYGNTIFHVEPNVKECPGGLRDYHLAQWLTLLNSVREEKAWPRAAADDFYGTHDEPESAYDFLSAVRCFLHYRAGRDDNTLDWHAQDEAAARSIGLETRGTSDPAYWMRTWYRQARTVYRRASLLIDAVPPPRRSFYKQFRRKRTPVPGTDFFLEDGRLDLAAGASRPRRRQHPADLRPHGQTRLSAEPLHRRSHRRRPARPRRADARRPLPVELPARSASRPVGRPRPAHHACPRHSRAAHSRIPRHRRPRHSRYLAPLHGR